MGARNRKQNEVRESFQASPYYGCNEPIGAIFLFWLIAH
jgi:hypothetical protein